MDFPRLTFDEVRVACECGPGHAHRAERIARLAFERVRELVGRELQHLSADVEVESVEVGPVHVSFETMGDDEIARAGADEIARALLHALRR
ncbi:MAG TPA: hypothetical protein VF736_07515 [Pyrinomonadaceae bacterium]|jgi:hypothetical protein